MFLMKIFIHMQINYELQMTNCLDHISFILINGSECLAGGVNVKLSNNSKFYG